MSSTQFADFESGLALRSPLDPERRGGATREGG